MNPYKSELTEVSALICSLIDIENKVLLKEINSLLQSGDDVVILLYSRRCLEVIVTELCETSLGRERGSEPMKGIIDRLFKDKVIPSFIHTSMSNLNNNSTYGAHPKEFDKRQVKTSLIDLSTILEWYFFDLKKLKRNIEPDRTNDQENSAYEPILSKKRIEKKHGFNTKMALIIACALLALLFGVYWLVLRKTPIEEMKGEKTPIDSIVAEPVEKVNNNQQSAIMPKDNHATTPKSDKTTNVKPLKMSLPENIDSALLILSDKSINPSLRKASAADFQKRFVANARVDILKNGYWVESKTIEDYLNWVVVSGGMYTIKVVETTPKSGIIQAIKVEQEKKQRQ